MDILLTTQAVCREFIQRLSSTPLGGWLVHRQVTKLEAVDQKGRLIAEKLGYAFDQDYQRWRHQDERSAAPPKFGDYWRCNRSVSLVQDMANDEIGVALSKESGASSTSFEQAVWRSSDHWLLRQAVSKDADQQIRNCIEAVAAANDDSEGSLTMIAALHSIFVAAAEKTQPHQFAIDKELTKIIEGLVAKLCCSQNDKERLYQGLQVVLSLFDYRVTTHGVARPFCMYDSDSLATTMRSALSLIDACQLFGLEGCLGYGAALGVEREGRLLDHDADIDVIIAKPGISREACAQLRQLLFAHLNAHGWACKLFDTPASQFAPNFYVQRKECKYDGRPDLCGFEVHLIEDTRDPEDVKLSHVREKLAWSDLFPAIRARVSDLELYLPRDSKEYCRKQYGAGWRTPRHFYVTWDPTSHS